MTYRELVYSILDLVALFSDDSNITEEHIIFLAGKWRSYLLELKYIQTKILGLEIPESNYLELCLELELVDGDTCELSYLRTTEKIPDTMLFANNEVVPVNYYSGAHITYVSKERMRYVGNNRWLRNIIYCSLAPDNYLYLTSSNPQFLYLKEIKFKGVFENPEEAAKYSCEKKAEEDVCDILDTTFPLEETLTVQLIDSLVKLIKTAIQTPSDRENNAMDDLLDIVRYIRSNMKSSALKAIDGTD